MSRLTKEITWKTGKLKASHGTPVTGRGSMGYISGRGRAGAEERCQKVRQKVNQQLQECKIQEFPSESV